jgi:hypothetical protein
MAKQCALPAKPTSKPATKSVICWRGVFVVFYRGLVRGIIIVMQDAVGWPFEIVILT